MWLKSDGQIWMRGVVEREGGGTGPGQKAQKAETRVGRREARARLMVPWATGSSGETEGLTEE